MKQAIQTLGTIATATAVLLSPDAALSQQVCLTHEKAALELERRFDERVIGRGLTPDGRSMFELFVSESGSWTVLVSAPSGQSCVVATGESWQRIHVLLGEAA